MIVSENIEFFIGSSEIFNLLGIIIFIFWEGNIKNKEVGWLIKYLLDLLFIYFILGYELFLSK